MSRRWPVGQIALFLLLMAAPALAQSGRELRFCIRSDPKTFNPILVGDDSSDTVRYLTGGVLVRINRQSQALEAALASSWKVSKDGRSITFTLRPKVAFSDGTPFGTDDVAYTVRQMFDPATHSPTADAFRSGAGSVTTQTSKPNTITVTFAAPIAGLDRLFDQVYILSAHSPKKEMAVLGPFYVADYKAGSYVLLNRNPNYWKRDAAGKPLPYLAAVRLDIQPNRDIELLKFQRGEIDLINTLDAQYFDKLASQTPPVVHEAGASMDTEQFWFNQVAKAPIPGYKLAWFRSQNFRRAISDAINRSDLCRVVFTFHARPAFGPVSPANRFWFNSSVPEPKYDSAAALKRLQQDGFQLRDGVLYDRDGHTVEFSVITNAGNKARERMAAMIQQDLSKIGIKLNVVTLDFPSLIERITEKFNYEAAMLGLVNDDLDPNAQMNVWLSSGENHQWNPGQKTPETAWEAEVDRLMQAQASTMDPQKRKQYFDRVQQIVYDQAPFLYLVNKTALSAVSPSVQKANPVVMRPQTFWNVDELSFSGTQTSQK